MAKILPGLAVAKMSGTILGTTYSNWRGMLVARSKPTPTNVNTPRQSIVRSILSGLATAWRDQLNAGQRQAWNNRASNYPWTDVFGGSIFMTGENLYIKQNFHLLDNNYTRVDTPVPDIAPPEITDIVDFAGIESLSLRMENLSQAIITAQAPFISVQISGHIVELEIDTPNYTTYGSGLAQGRTPQKSDYKHAMYVPEAPQGSPSGNQTVIASRLGNLDEGRKMTSLILRRFNKYGNFSAPLVFTKVIEAGL